MRLKDILLLPRGFYNRLTDAKITLIIGMLLVGVRNIGFYLWWRREGFAPRSFPELVLGNIGVVLGFVVLIGIIDVIFFSYPVFDLVKLLNRREENPTVHATAIKVMKVYILANIIVTPLDLVFTWVASSINLETASYYILVLVEVLSLLSMMWYLCIIARGLTSLFEFKNRRAMFAVIFIIALLYNNLLGYAYDFIYQKGLLALLK